MVLKYWKDFKEVQMLFYHPEAWLSKTNLGLSGHSLTVYKHVQ